MTTMRTPGGVSTVSSSANGRASGDPDRASPQLDRLLALARQK